MTDTKIPTLKIISHCLGQTFLAILEFPRMTIPRPAVSSIRLPIRAGQSHFLRDAPTRLDGSALLKNGRMRMGARFHLKAGQSRGNALNRESSHAWFFDAAKIPRCAFRWRTGGVFSATRPGVLGGPSGRLREEQIEKKHARIWLRAPYPAHRAEARSYLH